MRDWKINPKILCTKHLMGNHVELHMFVGTLNKGVSIQGYLDKGLIEVHNIKKRHEELVKEIESRGFKHNSPLVDFKEFIAGEINIEENVKDLINRCPECKRRYLLNQKIEIIMQRYRINNLNFVLDVQKLQNRGIIQ